LVRDFIDIFVAQGHGDATARSHGVDGDRKTGLLAADDRFLKEERFAATGGFHFPIGPFGYEQIGIDRDGDALEFARRL